MCLFTTLEFIVTREYCTIITLSRGNIIRKGPWKLSPGWCKRLRIILMSLTILLVYSSTYVSRNFSRPGYYTRVIQINAADKVTTKIRHQRSWSGTETTYGQFKESDTERYYRDGAPSGRPGEKSERTSRDENQLGLLSLREENTVTSQWDPKSKQPF